MLTDATVIAIAIPSSILLAYGIVHGAVGLARMAFEGNSNRVFSDPCHTTNRDPYTQQADLIRKREREG